MAGVGFTTGLGAAGLGGLGLDTAGGFGSVFCLEATAGRGFVVGLFGREEAGGDGLTVCRAGALLTTTCRVQFRCRAGLSAQASM